MEVGDTVEVYEDPIDQKRMEGHAKLIECQSKSSGWEDWTVRFSGEAEICHRSFFMG